MPASDAQIAANRRNAERSSGPKTDEGKARSRRNSLAHGLTGAGVVLAEADAAEVDRLALAFCKELDAPGESGEILARRMAVMSVRMDRSVDRERACLAERVDEAIAEVEVPETATDEEAEALRKRAADLARFDPSKEAQRARQYEAAAERTFFKALKELRQLKKDDARSAMAEQAAQARRSLEKLGSFSEAPRPADPPAPKPAPAPSSAPAAAPVAAKPAQPPAVMPLDLPSTAWDPYPAGTVDVPIRMMPPR